MAELNKIRLLLLVLLMTFPAHALDVIFSNALEDFKQKSKISTNIVHGEKTYVGTLDPLTYQPKNDTTKVIVHIIDRSRFVEIIRNAVRETRLQIAEELSEWHCELVFLGIDNFEDNEYHLISAFMLEKIQPQNEEQPNFTIETIGESRFDRVYPCFVMNFQRYRENPHICGGTLRARLRDIPRGALSPVESVERNGKEIRLYGYHPTAKEVRWPVDVVNNSYFPRVNLMDSKYNFRIRSQRKKICVLILGGKEYSEVMKYGFSILKVKLNDIRSEMTSFEEGLIILGAFNFDWTEIYIVAQIILAHSVGLESSKYNVFTCGYGMFNSYYLNEFETDGRCILPQRKASVSELITVLMGGEVKERSIHMHYSDDGWKVSEIPIQLGNGRYFPAERLKNVTFPWVNQKIAFIVYNSSETNVAIDYSMVYQSMEQLKLSRIYVVVIEAINFGLYDVHIIAEWIDYHRGLGIQHFDGEVIDSEQIVVLGGGIFDTIFQSKSTTYNTLFDTNKNELKNIRNAFVNKGNEKRVFTTKLFKSNSTKLDVRTYPMNTINGFYEPDLIPDKKMFDTTNNKKIFFIITSAYIFHQIPAVTENNVRAFLTMFREKMENYYSLSEWSIFLVGLDNFKERDYHLFAELIKMQTHDERPLDRVVRTFNYALGPPIYQCKDNPPLPDDSRSRVQTHITAFLGWTRRR